MDTRSLINAVRYILEDLVPPAIRDSRLAYGLHWLYYRSNTRFQTDFRRHVPTMSDELYEEYYRTFPGFDTKTYCNENCLRALPELVQGGTVLDAGCGRGFVADLIRRSCDVAVSAIDFILPDDVRANYPSVDFRSARI